MRTLILCLLLASGAAAVIAANWQALYRKVFGRAPHALQARGTARADTERVLHLSFGSSTY